MDINCLAKWHIRVLQANFVWIVWLINVKDLEGTNVVTKYGDLMYDKFRYPSFWGKYMWTFVQQSANVGKVAFPSF